MKTQNTNTMNLEAPLKELSKAELRAIKFTIILFGAVLNICCIQLLF